jgi:hypothetical protein
VADPFRFVRGDWPTQFFPWYSYLGAGLRAGNIPGWNPHQPSGLPFAADPQSGWAYLPSMILYTLLAPEGATTAFIGFQLLLSGLATFALARVLGLNIPGALVAGVACMAPWALLTARQLPWLVTFTAWIPVVALGAEVGLRARRPFERVVGWALSGLALSQLFGFYIGQFSYYGVMVLGSWLAYRTLLVPAQPAPFHDRLTRLLGHGIAIMLIAVGLGAAGILPRLEANTRTNIAGGEYNDDDVIYTAEHEGNPVETVLRLGGGLNQSRAIVGAATLALAVLAPFVARRWMAMPYFAVLLVTVPLLAWDAHTPVHRLLYLVLPLFERVHAHSPGKIEALVAFPATMLAGSAVSFLTVRTSGASRVSLVAGALLGAAALAVFASQPDPAAAALPLLSVAAVGGVVACGALLPTDWKDLLVPSLLAIVLWQGVFELRSRELGPLPERWGSLYQALGSETDRFLYDNPVAAAITEAPGAPHRNFGYEPGFLPPPEGDVNAYRNAVGDPGLIWLLVDNWAMWFGLDSAQGYTPMQVLRYVEYVAAMNGHRQEYHASNVFPGGIASPLLDLLALDYVIVPANAPERTDLRALAAELPTVYQDANVRILENTEAFPRAWLVHQARQVKPGSALPLLASGAVNPRHTALLEVAPPPLSEPEAAANEQVTREQQADPDHLALRVDAAAPALLVLSEVWDPGWSATVDGTSAPVLLANHVFRAVPVPAGVHQVELHYDPPFLRLGILISLATSALVLAAWVWLRAREQRRPPSLEGPAA